MMDAAIGTDVGTAAKILSRGGIVGIPTETVYGLAANALDPVAVSKVFRAKGRPFFDPLIVHLGALSWLPAIARDVPEIALQLMERFWPGPLTLVLPKSDSIPALVTSGLDSVAVRMPNHPVASELLRRSQLPLAAPSANLFGRVSPTTAQHVYDQLGDRIDYILDGGPCTVGLESTVLRVLPVPCLLRPGGIPLEEIEELIGPVAVTLPTDHPSDSPQVSPGLLPQHYAPHTRLEIIKTSDDWSSLPQPEDKVGVLVFQTPPAGLFADRIEILSKSGNLQEAAVNFFSALRRLDDSGVTVILAELCPETGLGRAMNDRLRRAATPNR